MCGRFGLPGDHEAMKRAFDVRIDLGSDVDWPRLMPRYNVAPTDQVPVIVERDAVRQAGPMRWGLMPFRTASMRGRTALGQNGKSINTPINARAETVHSNGMFKRSFEKRRCIVPAGGFYEWKRDGEAKVPYWVYLRDGSWMGFAGLYTWWKSPDGEWVPSCNIITTSPNSFMEPIHDRMPVILTPGAYDLWLAAEATDQAELKELLVPYPADEMKAHPVSTLLPTMSLSWCRPYRDRKADVAHYRETAPRSRLGVIMADAKGSSLSGVAKCVECEATLRTMSNRGIARMVCITRLKRGGCSQKSARLDAYESRLLDYLDAFRIPEDYQKRLLGAQRQLARAYEDSVSRKKQLTSALGRLKDLYKWGDIEREQYLTESREMEAELESLVHPADDGKVSEKLARFLKNVPQAWREAAEEQRN